MSNSGLGILITLDIALALLGLLVAVIGLWIIVRQAAANTNHIAQIAERIDARLRRQYPDIDQDLGS